MTATVAVGIWLLLLEQSVGGQFLDLLADSDAVLCQIEGMSLAERRAHGTITSTIDSIYPLLYGALLAGITWRFTSGRWRWLVAPAIIAVVLDFTENRIQVLALMGKTELVGWKEIVTPLKFALVITAFAVAVVLLFRSLVKHYLGSRSNNETSN